MARAIVRQIPTSQLQTPEQRARSRAEELLETSLRHEATGNNFMAMRCFKHALALLNPSTTPTTDIVQAANYGPDFKWVYNHRSNTAVYKR